MSYGSFETSTESGQPVEVYKFVLGSLSFYYTSAEDTVTLGIQSYTPNGTKRDKVTAGAENRQTQFSVTMPTSDPLVQLFIGSIPSVRLRMTVYRFHRNDTPTPGQSLQFDGFVQSFEFSQNMEATKLVALPIIAGQGRQIPRRNCDASCDHVHYDPTTCKVDSTNSAFRASNYLVTSQVGNVLTIAGLSPTYPDGWFDGGLVQVVGSSDVRLALAQVGNAITLLLPFGTAPTHVTALAGCAHNIQICKSKFNNVLNFGGFAFVPTVNPYKSGIV